MNSNQGRPKAQSHSGSFPAIEQSIGRYRLLRYAGTGGMAQVFVANREGPEGFAKPYVLKRILPEYARDEQFAKMFVVEARIAAMLDHPNIVHVFDFEVDNGNYYLVMEYVSGASLATILRASRRRNIPLGPQAAVELGLAVAQALAYAHDVTTPDGRALELVHRDISPGNVLVSRDGAVKLADFGVVKTAITSASVGVNGKWSYMSPEQIQGHEVDRRSDLFSLGIVLYEVVTGVRLFRRDSPSATAAQVVSGRIPPLREAVPDVDPRLDHVVMKLLERDPRARYQSAAALAADLEALWASPSFSMGGSRLRGVVKTLIPEEASGPALGASFNTDVSRSISVAPTAAAPATRDEPSGAPSGEARNAPMGRGLGQLAAMNKVPLAIAAACVVASVLFWLIVVL